VEEKCGGWLPVATWRENAATWKETVAGQATWKKNTAGTCGDWWAVDPVSRRRSINDHPNDLGRIRF
jgi:hypothetical protein